MLTCVFKTSGASFAFVLTRNVSPRPIHAHKPIKRRTKPLFNAALADSAIGWLRCRYSSRSVITGREISAGRGNGAVGRRIGACAAYYLPSKRKQRLQSGHMRADSLTLPLVRSFAL